LVNWAFCLCYKMGPILGHKNDIEIILRNYLNRSKLRLKNDWNSLRLWIVSVTLRARVKVFKFNIPFLRNFNQKVIKLFSEVRDHCILKLKRLQTWQLTMPNAYKNYIVVLLYNKNLLYKSTFLSYHKTFNLLHKGHVICNIAILYLQGVSRNYTEPL
jgi:hypothetical protein